MIIKRLASEFGSKLLPLPSQYILVKEVDYS